jgi:heme exporter protein A
LTPEAAPLLEVRELQLWRGERHVLRGLSFTLDAGRSLQVTWSNGAGKTTLLRALAGLLYPDSGEIRWRGRSIATDLRVFHRDIAFFSHELGLKPDLTVDENLRFVVALRRQCSREQRRTALARVGLAGFEDEPARRLSAGQQRRAALARLRLQGATLWLLDEPAAHLDTQGQQLVADLIAEHVREGGLAIIATHQPLALDADSSAELPAFVARAALTGVAA